jgi:hypothetical protein
MRAGAARDLCNVKRRSETRDDYADVAAGFATAGQAWVNIRRDTGVLQDYGAGEQPRGGAKGEAHFHADIQERDVLEVIAGPDDGTNWLVESVFHPGGQQKDLVLSIYTGSLT